MPEIERPLGKSAREEIAEIKTAVIALLDAIKVIEKLLDEPIMKEGIYCGIEFKD